MEWTLPFCPLGSSLYPENTGEPGPGSQLPHRQPGVLLAEARQGPFQCPSVQAGHSFHKPEEGLGGLRGPCQHLGAQAGPLWSSLPGTLRAWTPDS